MKLTALEEMFLGARRLYSVKNKKREKLLQMKGKIGNQARFLSPIVKLYRGRDFPMGIMQYGLERDLNQSPLMKGVEFTGELYDYQKDVLDRVLENNKHCGLLCASMGAGKTVMISWLIAHIKKPTLVLVKNITLLYQMQEEILRFTNLGKDDVGQWGDKKKEESAVTIMTQAGFIKDADKLENGYGMVIVDEADCFVSEKVLDKLIPFKTEHMFAFTATPYTNDFDESAISLIFGKITRADYTNLTPKIITFCYKASIREYCETWQEKREVYIDMNEERLEKQVRILENVKEKFSHTLVLYDRIETVERVADMVGCHKVIGATTRSERDEIVSDFRSNGGMIVATESTLGRGFNAPEIECVCLFFPNRFDGRVRQMVGRALRKRPGKDIAYILDWNDRDFLHQYRQRKTTYKELWGDNVDIEEKNI